MEKNKIKIKKVVNAIYPSSLIQQNFGESVSKHGFVLWDLEDISYKHYEVENKTPYYQFKITSIKDLDNGTEKITNL